MYTCWAEMPHVCKEASSPGQTATHVHGERTTAPSPPHLLVSIH
jgi:hypothetical protein